MREHPLMWGLPPEWASAWGQDRFGPFVAFEVEGVEQRLRWIAPGRFVMGSPETEAGRFGREVQHPVVLTQGFWLGEVPVVQSLWVAVMGSNPSHFQSPERPVEQVSWEDCQLFCEKLATLVPGLHPRLPSEAEWEYAARGGTITATYNGDLEIVGENNVPVLDEIAWYGGNSGVDFELEDGWDSSSWLEKQYAHTKAGTHLVRRKRANVWGLYDMLGNVYEWCQDSTDLKSYIVREQYDPISTTGSKRVIRGGSWYVLAKHVRAANRDANEPGKRFGFLGFRLAGGPSPRSRAELPRDGESTEWTPAEENQLIAARIARTGERYDTASQHIRAGRETPESRAQEALTRVAALADDALRHYRRRLSFPIGDGTSPGEERLRGYLKGLDIEDLRTIYSTMLDGLEHGPRMDVGENPDRDVMVEMALFHLEELPQALRRAIRQVGAP